MPLDPLNILHLQCGVKYRTAIEVLFLYCNLCLSVMLDSLSSSFTSISLLTKWYLLYYSKSTFFSENYKNPTCILFLQHDRTEERELLQKEDNRRADARGSAAMDQLRRDKIFREFEETKQIKARYDRFVENTVGHLLKLRLLR